MHRTILFAGLALASAIGLSLIQPSAAARPAQPAAAPDDYEIDLGHSAILFRAKHLGVSYAYGRFNDFGGTVTFDPQKVENSKATITIQTKSIDTMVENRDDHLRSPDFLDAAQFPEAKFTSKSVKKIDATHFTLEGDLTLHGVTKPVKLDVEHVGSTKHARMGEIAGFHGILTFKRSDFGISFMTDGLSDEVQLTISLECGKVQAAEKSAK